jgi:CDP-glycerol glycerophosphotransferase
MFCDSDDEFERHACKNLLQAAEQTGADVVCGTAKRVALGARAREAVRPYRADAVNDRWEQLIAGVLR